VCTTSREKLGMSGSGDSCEYFGMAYSKGREASGGRSIGTVEVRKPYSGRVAETGESTRIGKMKI
jgi:hypothetical protein